MFFQKNSKLSKKFKINKTTCFVFIYLFNFQFFFSIFIFFIIIFINVLFIISLHLFKHRIQFFRKIIQKLLRFKFFIDCINELESKFFRAHYVNNFAQRF